MSTLFKTVAENLLYVLSFLLIIFAMFVIAYVVEKAAKKKVGDTERILTTRKVAVCGVFSAIAAVLMLLEIPLFFAPTFYKLDLSELPILIGSFAFGPVAGVMMEFVKIVLKLFIKGTSTAFVGELANFAVGCSFIMPASIYYLFHKNKKGAFVSCAIGTVIITIFGTLFNAVYLLPTFAKLFGMPLEAIIEMGSAVNKFSGSSVTSFVIACVAPLNLLKGAVNSLVTLLVYKKVSPIIKEGHVKATAKVKVTTED